jgi:dTDP-4-amino-4,6-dideoxygalactose transaminase
MPVDIGGLPADQEAMMRIAEEARAVFVPQGEVQQQLGRILVMSDAAHSFGATIGAKRVGAIADITGFSFHAVKNLTTAEGGALALHMPGPFDNEALYTLFNIMSLHGQSKDALSKMQAGAWRYDVTMAGWKCNMTDLQAAIGLVELERYDSETIPRRKAICERYNYAFGADARFIAPLFADTGREGSYHLYMLRLSNATEAQRDAVIAAIARHEVSVNVHFIPMPMLTVYKERGYRIADFPNTFRHYSREISLPVYYDLTDEQVDTVVAAVRSAVDEVMG